MVGVGQSSNRDSAEGCEETFPAIGREASEREEEEKWQYAEVRYWEEVVVYNQGWVAMGKCPEEEKGEGQGNGEEEGKSVSREIVGRVSSWRRSRRVVYKGWDILN